MSRCANLAAMALTGPARHPYLDHPGRIGFAHRGGAGDWPENTMPAFRSAVAMGYRYLETDVQATADGVLLAFHDDDLMRSCQRPGRISELSYAEIKGSLVDGKEPIPLMSDLLEEFPEARFNIDCKTDAGVEPLMAMIGEHKLLDRVCLGSFSHRRLVRMRRTVGPSLLTSMSPNEVAQWRAGRPPKDVLVAQVPVKQGPLKVVTRWTVDLAHRRGIAVHVWTIDDPQEMRRLLELGVNGLMTDRPVILKEVMQQRGEWADGSSTNLSS
jgi:glycerophosphoryl diester phosphodiesterase